MLVISLALAAVMLAGSGERDTGSSTTASEATSINVAPTPVPASPTPPPALPTLLEQRLNALPEKLRTEVLLAYAAGTLSTAQVDLIATQYENRNPSVRVGSVLSASGDVLQFELFTTGEAIDIAIEEHTLVRRGEQDVAIEDLLTGELVMVVSTRDGRSALNVEAFGVSAP